MASPDPHTVGVDLLVTTARLTRWAARHAHTAVPAAHLRALSQIDELGPARIGDLAVADRCSQPTMSALVRRLEEQGYTERLPDPDDSRASRIALTVAGREQLAAVRATGGGAIGDALSRLDPEDLEHVAAAVEAFRRVLAAPSPAPPSAPSSAPKEALA
ncbi:MAG TPA: MarR family transcriptional regulator [Nocardioidaceae bacterium]|nr:MarR family transcriptional regulator [Nocardioidaceae bacterium]